MRWLSIIIFLFAGQAFGMTSAEITSTNHRLLNTTVGSSCAANSSDSSLYDSCNIKYLNSVEGANTPVVRTGTTSMAAATTSVAVDLTAASFNFSQTMTGANGGTTFNSTYSFPNRTTGKTVAFFTHYCDGTQPDRCLVVMDRTESGGNLTTLTFSRGSGTSTAVYIRYWVVYFPDNVTVTPGTFSMAGGTATATANPSFTTTKSFIIFNYKTSGTTIQANTMVRVTPASTNPSLTFTRDNSTTATITGAYQVVEFTSGGTAQHGTITLSAVTSNTASITSVDTTRTMLLTSCAYNQNSGSLDVKTSYATLTNATTVTITRMTGTNTLTCDYQAFQFPALKNENAPTVATSDGGAAMSVVKTALLSQATGATSATNADVNRQSSIVIPTTLFFNYVEDSTTNTSSRTLQQLDFTSGSTAFANVRALRGDGTNAAKVQYNLITFGDTPTTSRRVFLIE